jgi:rhodanese-related sulfurtransferase
METVELPPEIRIKFLSKFKPGHDGEGWLRLFPRREPVWGNCRFSFDRHCRDYDWLVVYDEMPSVAGERRPLWQEELACPAANTLLMTTEPSTIKAYGSPYLQQFRWVLSTQEDWAIGHHPGRLFEQPALTWFYSTLSPRGDYDTLIERPALDKSREISTVCSSKTQRHTIHSRRYSFTMALKERIPDLDIFGHGIRFLEEKADALDPYRYHLAIENFVGPHHWTEKIADTLLACCLPFYYGCPNIFDYFPEESLVVIDISDPDVAAEIILKSIRDDLHAKRLPAIMEARRLVLDRYGPIATVCRIVNQHHVNTGARSAASTHVIKSRHLLKRNPWLAARFVLEKLRVRTHHAFVD